MIKPCDVCKAFTDQTEKWGRIMVCDRCDNIVPIRISRKIKKAIKKGVDIPPKKP